MHYKNLYELNKIKKDVNKVKRFNENNISVVPFAFDENKNREYLRYAYLGHSSVFISVDSTNILIDPVFSKRVGPKSIIGSKRLMKNIPNTKDMPIIDVVLITHNHYDHLDYKTTLKINSKAKLFVVPLGVKKTLIRFGILPHKIVEVGWGDDYIVKGVKINCTYAQHNSTRYLFDINKSLWCSYVIESSEFKIYHSGDSAYTNHFKDLYLKFGDFDLVFMECGQYGSLWHHMHMFPEESVEACEDLHARLSIPIHHSTYKLAFHNRLEPIYRFKKKALLDKAQIQIPVVNKIYCY